MKLTLEHFKFKILFLLMTGMVYGHVTMGQPARFNNSILWEIRKTDSSKPSYLLGTVHIIDTSKYSIPMDTFVKLISRCNRLCTEILMNVVDDTFYLSSKKKRDKSNYKSLDKKHRKKLDEVLMRFYHSRGTVRYIKRKFNLYELYTFVYYMRERMLDNTKVFLKMDNSLREYAIKSNRVTSLALEDTRTHFRHFDLLVNDSLTSYGMNKLLDSFDNRSYPFEPEAADSMRFNYYEQIFDEMNTYPVLKTPDDSASNDIMILRNRIMANTLDSLLELDKPFFAAAGCGHLFGYYGMLNLLESKGYIIRPYPIVIRKK